jgi:hypothetical protein
LSQLYIHLDTISNAVTAYGLKNQDFLRPIRKYPNNLLVLDPNFEQGTYDSNSGLRYIEGQREVTSFFRRIRNRRKDEEVRWIDFNEVSMLERLSPLEISELLYLGHMRKNLHSPFFYKLQNNFIYFEFSDAMSKIFYRHLDEFHRVLNKKIVHTVFQRMNMKKIPFTKHMKVEHITREIIDEIRELLSQGLVFDFSQEGMKEQQYVIPMYVIEDSYKKIHDELYKKEELVANLIYDLNDTSWKIKYID